MFSVKMLMKEVSVKATCFVAFNFMESNSRGNNVVSVKATWIVAFNQNMEKINFSRQSVSVKATWIVAFNDWCR